MLRQIVGVAFLLALAGCGGGVEGGSTGSRCTTGNDCDDGETCKTDFPYERSVCTLECEEDDDCAPNAECVSGLKDYDGQDMMASFCLIPCESDKNCPGTVCDDRPLDTSYCF